MYSDKQSRHIAAKKEKQLEALRAVLELTSVEEKKIRGTKK
jgi:hypothetical protein